MKENIPVFTKKLRQRLDLTQEQFAQRIVSYSTVNHWENGKQTPHPRHIQRLLEIGRELGGKKAKEKP